MSRVDRASSVLHRRQLRHRAPLAGSFKDPGAGTFRQPDEDWAASIIVVRLGHGTGEGDERLALLAALDAHEGTHHG